MKTAVNAITATALLGIVVGGSILDSTSLVLPVMMIVPSLAWLFLLGVANR